MKGTWVPLNVAYISFSNSHIRFINIEEIDTVLEENGKTMTENMPEVQIGCFRFGDALTTEGIPAWQGRKLL